MENNKNAHGKVYKITDSGYNECYYGSTIQQLSSRMGKHRTEYARGEVQGFSITSFHLFDKYGIEDSKIEWLRITLVPVKRSYVRGKANIYEAIHV